MDKCKFCSKKLSKCYEDRSNGRFHIECPMCGIYQIDENTTEDIGSLEIPQNDLLLFSGYIRNNFFPANPILITYGMCAKISEIISPFKNMPVPEKVNNIFKYFYENTSKVLTTIILTNDDIYRFFLLEPGDLIEILNYLHQRNFIRYDKQVSSHRCYTTIAGWERYEKLKEANIFSKRVFIACAFDSDYGEKLVKTIKDACSKCGFNANLISDKKHNDDISHKIISDIKESRFIIADFTDQNNGAYFEAGYAMGIGLEVIKLCRKDHMDDLDPKTGKRKKLHFDTRQYYHIVWEDNKWNELEENLINQIKATINKHLSASSN